MRKVIRLGLWVAVILITLHWFWAEIGKVAQVRTMVNAANMRLDDYGMRINLPPTEPQAIFKKGSTVPCVVETPLRLREAKVGQLLVLRPVHDGDHKGSEQFANFPEQARLIGEVTQVLPGQNGRPRMVFFKIKQVKLITSNVVIPMRGSLTSPDMAPKEHWDNESLASLGLILGWVSELGPAAILLGFFTGKSAQEAIDRAQSDIYSYSKTDFRRGDKVGVTLHSPLRIPLKEM